MVQQRRRQRHRGQGRHGSALDRAGFEKEREAAVELIMAGVPVFVARRAVDADGQWIPDGGHGNTGYHFPPRWQESEPDLSVLDEWEVGDALMAVMGHGVDALDIDPRSGGEDTYQELVAEGIWPQAWARQSTPSGGFHELIPSLGLASKDGALSGLDIKAGTPDGGHGAVFIPPTQRLSKSGTGEVAHYEWELPPRAEELASIEPAGEEFRETVNRDRAPDRRETPGTPVVEGVKTSTATTPGARRRVESYLDAVLARMAKELEEAQSWDEGYRQTRINLADGKVQPITERGWQKLVADQCHGLGALSRADWTTWTPADARDRYLEIVPEAIAEAVDVAQTWRDQHTRGEPPSPPSWLTTQAPSEASAGAGSLGFTWIPQDLDLLESRGLPAEPSIADVHGGMPLFYPGRVNGLAGASGAGKSWAALVTCAEQIAAGSNVVYIDYEDSAQNILARLGELGLGDEQVQSHFTYIAPAEPFVDDQDAARGHLEQVLRDKNPTVVVIDSLGESMAMAGQSSNEDLHVARWYRELPAWIAERGPAVVVLDHLPKSHENQASPIGSQRKVAATSGALYILRAKEPFSRGVDGQVALECRKDRMGYHAVGDVAAYLQVEHGVSGEVRMTFRSAGQGCGSPLEDAILAALSGGPMNTRKLESVLPGAVKKNRQALSQLVDQGSVVREKRGNAIIYSLPQGSSTS